MKKLIAVALMVCCGLFLVGCGGMDADSQKAYESIEKASAGFKDPSSVRIMSGDFYVNEDGEEYLCAVLSATNSWGARGNDPYMLIGSGAINLSDYSSVTKEEIAVANKDSLDYDAINKKLDEKWESFN